MSVGLTLAGPPCRWSMESCIPSSQRERCLSMVSVMPAPIWGWKLDEKNSDKSAEDLNLANPVLISLAGSLLFIEHLLCACRELDNSCERDGWYHSERRRWVQHQREAETSASCSHHDLPVEHGRRLRTSCRQEARREKFTRTSRQSQRYLFVIQLRRRDSFGQK